MILVVVYSALWPLLFLFVVMMLDVDFAELRKAFSTTCGGRLVGVIFLAELLLVVFAWVDRRAFRKRSRRRFRRLRSTPNTQALGLVLLTRYVFFFQTAGLVLLVAMIAPSCSLCAQQRCQAANHRRAGRSHQGDSDRDPESSDRRGDPVE